MLLFMQRKNKIVIPAKAGIQCILVFKDAQEVWIPAFAGMTVTGCKRLPIQTNKLINNNYPNKRLNSARKAAISMGLDTKPSAPACLYLNWSILPVWAVTMMTGKCSPVVCS